MKNVHFSTLVRRQMLLTLVPLVALGLSQAAQGAMSLTVGPAGSEVTLDETQGTVVDLGNGAVSWVGEFAAADGSWEVDWALVLNPDPSLAGVLAVTNNTGGDAMFTSSVSVTSVDVIAAGNDMSGSASITIIDSGFDSAGSVSPPSGGAIYTALINGVVQKELFRSADFTSLSVSGLGASAALTNGFLAEPTITDIALGNLVTIQHGFILSDGDTGSVTSSFIVVPEPTVGLLFLVGSASLTARRKRRRSA